MINFKESTPRDFSLEQSAQNPQISSTKPLIKLVGVRKIYGKGKNTFEALKGIDLEIHRGEFIALMGPSGSGKSSLANILGTLDVGSKGKYIFQNIDVFNLSQNERALLRRQYIGFIFQGFNLLPRMSALENVELPLLYRGMKKNERERIAMDALELVGLNSWAKHTNAELSGGQQQRVAIARAIVINPLFLLADEPTGNLDSTRSVEIMEILQNLNSEMGITILMVTHENDMAAYASRRIHCVDGKIQDDGNDIESRACTLSKSIDKCFKKHNIAQNMGAHK